MNHLNKIIGIYLIYLILAETLKLGLKEVLLEALVSG